MIHWKPETTDDLFPGAPYCGVSRGEEGYEQTIAFGTLLDLVEQ